MRRRFILGALLALLVLVPATATIAADGPLADVKRATARFANVALAEAAGYEEFLDCFDSEAGGMGQHYVNFGLLDTTVQRQKPEAMVYQVDGSRLRLVAVEYLVPIADWTEDHPPRLFGRHFHPNEELGVYVLHAWIFKRNPAGLFTDYNPNVPACP